MSAYKSSDVLLNPAELQLLEMILFDFSKKEDNINIHMTIMNDFLLSEERTPKYTQQAVKILI